MKCLVHRNRYKERLNAFYGRDHFFLYRFFDEHKVRHMLVSLHRWKEWEKKCKL